MGILTEIPCVKGLQGGGELTLGLWLLLSVDGRYVGGGFGMRCYKASLFPMPNEVFDVLYCAHGGELEELGELGGL